MLGFTSGVACWSRVCDPDQLFDRKVSRQGGKVPDTEGRPSVHLSARSETFAEQGGGSAGGMGEEEL
jgi:hypothetical protein